MDRRRFLESMIAAGLVATIDPERLLWELGKKLISVPKPQLSFMSCGTKIERQFSLVRMHNRLDVLYGFGNMYR